ncbi:MurR/RpiR family transcriptional regulator [Spiroplasma sp. SV19]|uniref:MurR/RpiR family transcriptional regulator n=1 Tax=Spiroplasma sp. SV19 TaxID=2570468 RepID=UPI0024B871BE|nr:MurR/RpiR family transcriptional regulator [Spiroplasma sp. SV19]WHQ37444.1 SIS domain-containing protein [Spiroplasma sp. SV19]
MLWNELIIKLENLKNNDHKFSHISIFILKNLGSIGKYTIYQVAFATYSSPASVTRMCQEIGLKGYKELINILTSVYQKPVLKEDTLANNLLQKSKINLDETASLLQPKVITTFVQQINQNKKLFLYAYGESALWLESFYSRLLRIGINAFLGRDHENARVSSQIIDCDTVILVLSLSGETKTVLELVKQARKKKAVIFSITKYLQNHLKKISDYNIALSYNPNENQLITKSARYSMLYILDLIYEEIIESDKTRYLDILENTVLKK